MHESVFDAILITMLLTLGFGVGYTELNKAHRNATRDTIVRDDKGAERKDGSDLKLYGEYDGSLNKYEAVLLTQVQDYYMPEPKSLAINGNVLQIKSTHESTQFNYGMAAWQSLKPEDTDSTKYRVHYVNKYHQTTQFKQKDDGSIQMGDGTSETGKAQKETVDKTIETFVVDRVE